MRPSSTIRLFLVPLLFCFALSAHAQFDTATLLGTVKDPSGAVVPDAEVSVTNTETGVTTKRTTSRAGDYEFVTLKAGRYLVTAERSGFAIAVVEDVRVEVAARLRVDLQLTVGGVTERVQVTAAQPLLETDTSQRGQVISGENTVALPLNGREYSALALLTNGVRVSPLRLGSTPREGAFNINGLRSTFNNFLIDGVDNNAYGTSNQGFSNQVMQPPPDAISEFKVVTNNQSAEYGRAAGGTVNVAYRSGGNRLSGAAWEFFRDTALNATGYFKPPTGVKPPLRRNQYGAVVGGPIVKNKAFFFADFEGFRQNRSQPAFGNIANAAQRQGVLTVDVRDPRTGATYAAGTPVPMTAFAQKVLAGLPSPTSTAANNFSMLQQFTNETDKAGGKVDVHISPDVTAFGRYGWRNLESVDQPLLPLPSGGSGNGTIYAKNKQLVAGATWVVSPTMLVEGRFGWSSTEGGKNPPGLGSTSALDQFGLAGLPNDPRIGGGLPTQLITGFSDLGRQATNPQWQFPTVFNPKLNVTRSAGRHSLKAGYEFQRIETQVQDVNPLYGRDTYSGQFSRPAGAAASNVYNLADFMLGLRSQYALSSVLIADLRQHMHFTYLQDDFRVGSKLTLNLGVRYEYAKPQWEANNVLSNWNPVTRQMIPAADGSMYDRALIRPDRNNLGPRLGLAYTVAPGTVIRSGWGIGYIHFHRAGGGNLLPINGPQSVSAVVNQNPADATFRPTEAGYPAGLADPARFNPLIANITYMPEDYRSSQVQSWFASVQRQVGRNMLLDVGYVGNQSSGLLMFANFNQAAPNNAAGSLSLAARRPIADMGDITYAFNGGKSDYHALQAKFDWRMRGDISLLSSLTLSRARDNGAGSLENINGNSPAPQDFRNLDAEWAHSAYDQPWNSTTSFVWQLPFGHGRRIGSALPKALDILVGGWQLAGINTINAGDPVTFTYTPAVAFQVSGIAQDFRGANNYRPNVTGDPLAPEAERTITNWFSRTAVTIPTDPSQPFGNTVRNSVRGPKFWQIDVAASKTVPMGRASLELRLEAFNLLNRSNFLAPNGNRSAAGFGTITSTYDARQAQLGVKLLW